MSVNPSRRLCLKPAELYLLVHRDRMLWTACDILERALPELTELSDARARRRLKATCAIWTGLISGSTRVKMIEVLKKLNYNKSYAEKLVAKEVGKYRDLFEKERSFRIKVEPVRLKGKFGKPGSKQSKIGRPPSKYKLEKISQDKPSKRMEELTHIMTLLSGSLIRFLKLLIKMETKPWFREIIVEAIGKMLPISTDKLEIDFKKMAEDRENIQKQIDDNYHRLMEPIRQDAVRILGLES